MRFPRFSVRRLSKQDALINLLEDYEILELARTGLTGLSRGADDIRYLP